MPADSPARLGSPKRNTRLLIAGVALLVVAGVVLALALNAGGGDSGESQAPPLATENEQEAATARTEVGELRAGDVPLLPASTEPVDQLIGDAVEGVNLTVQTVDNDRGFWVGTSGAERFFVHHDGDFTPQPSDRVDLSGTVREAPQRAADEFGLGAADGEQLSEQGAYIEADSVEASQG